MILNKLASQQSSDGAWTPQLETCVYVIRNMPDLMMEHRHGILLDFTGASKDEIEIIQDIRKEYRNKAAWLEYYLLDKTDLLPELTFTSKVNYKFFAETTLAFLKLAQEVYPRSDLAQSQKLTPRAWMVLCEADLCDMSLSNSGYTGNAQPTGKRELYEYAMQYCEQMEDAQKLSFVKATDGTALELLESEAAFIAKHDVRFCNSYYREFLKKLKRHYRNLKNSPLQITYLEPDGSTKALDKGRDARQRKASRKSGKGFG